MTILQHHKLKCSPKLRQSIHYFYKWLWTLTAVPSWSRLYILITICHWYLRCAAFFPISWEHSKSFLGLHHHHQNLFVAAKINFFSPVSFSYFILHADKEMGTEHMFLPHAATNILSKGTNLSVICWSDSRSFFELGALVMFEWFIRQG